jgi:hypothetical protein
MAADALASRSNWGRAFERRWAEADVPERRRLSALLPLRPPAQTRRLVRALQKDGAWDDAALRRQVLRALEDHPEKESIRLRDLLAELRGEFPALAKAGTRAP